jgi:hypothetical protein
MTKKRRRTGVSICSSITNGMAKHIVYTCKIPHRVLKFVFDLDVIFQMAKQEAAHFEGSLQTYMRIENINTFSFILIQV